MESSPLVTRRRQSLASQGYGARDNASVMTRLTSYSFSLKIQRSFIRRRFWWFCAMGAVALVVLQLSFLPRTSMNRDFRRWYDLHLTRSDVKRIFLVQSAYGRPLNGATVEENIAAWTGNMSRLSAKNPCALTASDSSNTAIFVEKSMRSLGLRCSIHQFPAPGLQTPILLSLNLVDALLGRTLYSANLLEPKSETPAYFPFGANGTVEAELVFVNGGLADDLAVLRDLKVSVKGKIALLHHVADDPYALEDKIAHLEDLGVAGIAVYGDEEIPESISRHLKPPTPMSPAFRLPISYSAAEPILEAMGASLDGAKSWKYAPAAGDNSLRLQITLEFSPRALNTTNIVGSIDGVLNDGVIIVGAPRDSLTLSNPQSGHAIMLEAVLKLQALRNLGWKPLRLLKFVSWDASRVGALGARAALQDDEAFHKNLPILAFINLSDDVVTGSHFYVEAHPFFNKIVRETAHLILFPKHLPYYKRLEKETERNGDDEDADSNLDDSSLYKYWRMQNNATIDNAFANDLLGSETGEALFQRAGPTINFGLRQSPTHNDSNYVQDSNFYNLKWVENELDKGLELHGVLVRFLGLLVVSLSEHEVVETRTRPWFGLMSSEFAKFSRHAENIGSQEIEASLLAKTSLETDLKVLDKDTLTLNDLLNATSQLISLLVDQGEIFDTYTEEVEDLWTTDYPWYEFLRKIHIWAKLKVANFKLLRLEREAAFKPAELEWLDNPDARHFLYEPFASAKLTKTAEKPGAFGLLYNAMGSGDQTTLVKSMAMVYERMKAIHRKIS